MGLYDRDYTQSDSRQRYGLPQMRFSLPPMTSLVQWLLIVNIAVFLVSLIPPVGTFLEAWFALNPQSWHTLLQPWRIVTYQFLHSRVDIWHIFFNMLALYFLGPPLERYWGSRRFLPFYLTCGAVGAIFYFVLVKIGFLAPGLMVGASGSILGLLSACAILFPHFVVFLFVFPVPIRVAAVAFAAMYVLLIVTRSDNAGGEAAHLAGMAFGAAYVLLLPRWGKLAMKVRAGSWEKKMEQSHRMEVEVDRILAKVHRQGLHSLTAREKRTLKRATQEEIKRHQL
jgi:membrane associated rhomboid family serine protease